MLTNPKLSEILNKSRKCSLELSHHRPVDFNILASLPNAFCSVIWIGTFSKPPQQIGPLSLAKNLIHKGHTVLLHFPGRNMTKQSCITTLDYAKDIGLRNLLCVRGATPECNIPDKIYDFPYALDLIKFIKDKYQDYFEIGVAGYPYKHIDSPNWDEEMKYMKMKNEAGAKFIVTQAAFTYEIYKEFLNNCRKYEINMDIIPGIYIIRSLVDFYFLQKLCKVPLDDPIIKKLKKIEGTDQAVIEFGLEASVGLLESLFKDKDFCPPHIFTMGELEATKDFLKSIGYMEILNKM